MHARFLFPLLLISASVHAATLAVLPNTSIQTKIDAAQPGDIVAIFGGTYNEDITINKAVRLVKVSGQSVTLAGNVTFSGLTSPPVFDGFTVGSSGRGINVNDTTGLVISNVDARAGSGITINGTSLLSIADSQLSNVYQNEGAVSISNSSLTGGINDNGASLKISKTTLAGNISQTAGTLHAYSVTIAGNFDTGSNAQKTVGFRTTVAGDCSWRSKRNWFGYSEARSFTFSDQDAARVVLVGNKIDRQGGEANGIYCSVSNSSILITNNQIVRVGYNWDGDAKNGIDLRGGGNKAVIANNYCQLQYYGRDAYGVRGDGIYVRDFTQAKIINNVVVGAKHGISAPFGVVAQNNLYWASPWSAREANGVAAEGTIYADPLFVVDQAPALQAGSPCINAGTPDPLHNDRDGSQNDIGPSGGAWFDPDGWTTDKPVVISFDLSPEQVLEGVDTEVTISNGGAVSQP
jgi:hypothetical protein